jgi:hypothetical protein
MIANVINKFAAKPTNRGASGLTSICRKPFKNARIKTTAETLSTHIANRRRLREPESTFRSGSSVDLGADLDLDRKSTMATILATSKPASPIARPRVEMMPLAEA